MICREARELAAGLVRDLRDQVITNDDFEDGWPASQGDRALWAIKRTLWGSYADHYTHRLSGEHSLNPIERALFNRCAIFLDTELEYEWPTSRLYYQREGQSLLLVLLSFGLLGLEAYISAKRYKLQEDSGPSELWPFIRRSDYENAVGK